LPVLNDGWFAGQNSAMFFGKLFACFYWAVKLESFSVTFSPPTDRFHLETRIADWTAMRAKCFVILLVSWIDRDIWGCFHLFSDESIKALAHRRLYPQER